MTASSVWIFSATSVEEHHALNQLLEHPLVHPHFFEDLQNPSSKELLKSALQSPELERLIIQICSIWLNSGSLLNQAWALHYIRGLGAQDQLQALTHFLFQSLSAHPSYTPLSWIASKNPLFYIHSSSPSPSPQGSTLTVQNLIPSHPEARSKPSSTQGNPQSNPSFSSPVIHPPPQGGFLPPSQLQYALPTLGQTAFEIALHFCPTSHPLHQQLLKWGILFSHLHSQVWTHWPANRSLLPLLPLLVPQLSQHPQYGSDLALRLALFHQSEVLIINQYWVNAFQKDPQNLKNPFLIQAFSLYLKTLEKQLQRVKKMRLWIDVKHQIQSQLPSHLTSLLSSSR